MAGLYEDEPPARPHAKCDCDVILVSPRDYTGEGDARDCRREMTYEFLSMEGLDSDGDTAVMGVDFMVHCPDGTDLPVSVEAEVDVRFLREWRYHQRRAIRPLDRPGHLGRPGGGGEHRGHGLRRL